MWQRKSHLLHTIIFVLQFNSQIVTVKDNNNNKQNSIERN